ncbi:hypothetical protein F4814DRAFT_411845 [Daldinia grandis]|nr:hypothetical protein F4814DRAFT_411845 [Daldinia grandis]
MSWYLAQRSGPCAVFHRTKIQLPTGSHCTAPYLCFPSSSCIALYYCIPNLPTYTTYLYYVPTYT